jgi:hypothetical protein
MAISPAVSSNGGSVTVSGSGKSAGTTFSFANTSAGSGNILAGTTVVVVIAVDNIDSSTPTVSSITKPGSETADWVKLANIGSATSTGAAGIIGEMWAL